MLGYGSASAQGSGLEGSFVKFILYTLSFSVHWHFHPCGFKHHFYAYNSQFLNLKPRWLLSKSYISWGLLDIFIRYFKTIRKGVTFGEHLFCLASNIYVEGGQYLMDSRKVSETLEYTRSQGWILFHFCLSLLFQFHWELNHCTCKRL